MFSVENNNITVTKGDWGKLNLKFKNADGSSYVVKDSDEIVFSVKKRREEFYPLVLEKRGEVIIFESEETRKIPTGEYEYDVVINSAGGEVVTAIEGKLKVRKAAHEL